MFEIIQHLRVARVPLTARELAERLEVSVRTVYRDVASLQALRVPVEGAPGIGYAMRPGYDLPPLGFADDELDALFIGLGLLGRTGDRSLERAASGALAKLVGTLTPPRRDAVDTGRWMISSWHDIPSGGTEPEPLRNAIRESLKVGFDYTDATGERTHRRVAPIGLLYYVDALVLAAWCELRGDYRHFRLDRMTECSVVAGDFPKPTGELLAGWRRRESSRRQG